MSKAPGFDLPATAGKSYSVSGLKPGDLAVVAFFKATCPTCMLAMPFVDKLFRSHQGDRGVRIFSVAQEPEREANDFAKRYDLKLPVALDQDPYRVSTQYGLTNVPTIVVVTPDGMIERTIVGFVKREYEALARRIAQAVNKAAVDLFAGVSVPELKPG